MAPFIAGLIKFGLPLLANAVASKGKEWVEEKTGVKLPDLTGAEPPPEVLLQLKQLEFDKQQLLIDAALDNRKLDVELVKVDAEDRDSARDREIKVGESEHVPQIGKITTPVLALFTVLGFFAVLVALIYCAVQGYTLQDGLKEVLYIMLGVLGTQTNSVYSYYFGSSSGSAQKSLQAGWTK
jgi:hypothetical protein